MRSLFVCAAALFLASGLTAATLPKPDWSILQRWQPSAGALDTGCFENLHASGIHVLHPETLDVASAWLRKWTRFTGVRPDYFLRIDESGDLASLRDTNVSARQS